MRRLVIKSLVAIAAIMAFFVWAVGMPSSWHEAVGWFFASLMIVSMVILINTFVARAMASFREKREP